MNTLEYEAALRRLAAAEHEAALARLAVATAGGEALRELRLARGLTQTTLARHLGTSVEVLSRAERGALTTGLMKRLAVWVACHGEG